MSQTCRQRCQALLAPLMPCADWRLHPAGWRRPVTGAPVQLPCPWHAQARRLTRVVAVQANEILHHKTTLNGYLAEFTGQPEDKIYIDTDRDFFLSAQESVEYGLIDAVISKPNIALAAAASNGAVPVSA